MLNDGWMMACSRNIALINYCPLLFKVVCLLTYRGRRKVVLIAIEVSELRLENIVGNR